MNRVLIMTTLLAGTASACVAQSADVTLTLSGRVRVVNGVDQVPRGLFGVHAMNGLTDAIAAEWGIESVRTIEIEPDGTPRRPGSGHGHGVIPAAVTSIVECWYDRYQPALQLTNPDGWQAKLRRQATAWGRAARDLPIPIALEFWNEPYLNWANNPGVNYDGRFYTRDGDAVLRQGRLQPTLAWTDRIVAIDPISGRIDYVATRYMPAGAKPGQSFDWRGRPWEARQSPWVRDTQQPVIWWSGPYNRELYHEMVSVLGPALKDAHPQATLVLGWGFHLFQDQWKAWDLLHRPLIDHAIAWMDGYNEHHYGGDTRAVAGSYEVAFAYAMAAHGKRLRFYNTETGGFLDPEQAGSGAAPGPGGDEAANARQGTAYMLRDVIHLIDVCPDKAVARAAHMPDVYGGQDAFKLLKPLRGTLMEIASSDPDVWAVASRQDDQLCVVAFNDSSHARRVTLGDDPPREIAPRQAAVWLLADDRDPASLPRTVWTQHVADKARQDVAAGASLQLTVALPAGELAAATAARIKFVQAPWARPAEGGLSVTLNGEPIELRPPHAGGWIGWTDIDPARLATINVLRFTAAAELARPAAVDALSIELMRVQTPEP